MKFGSAWPGENKDNEIVSIPGLRGREPKEITLKNLSNIIHARVSEIIEQVFQEIKNYGYDTQKGKLIAGIVLTGGGAELKHLKQLVEYITGMDTRIGFPNEHLAGGSDEQLSSPIYATSVGLVMEGLEQKDREFLKAEQQEEIVVEEKVQEVESSQEEQIDEEQDSKNPKKKKRGWTIKTIFEGISEYLDSME